MPKVAVVIPSYNCLNYLPRTLDSLLNQTFTDYEAIVVNDGSTDETKAWFDREVKDPRVKMVSQENQGLAIARNTGIINTTAKYVAFLDSDDLWEPTKLEKQVACLDENPEIGLVYTWTTLIDEEDKPTGRIFNWSEDGNVWKTLTHWNLIGCGSVAMVRRVCLDEVGLFEPRLSRFNVNEDWEMWLRISARYPFKAIKEPLVYYRQTIGSASKRWETMEESFQIVIEKTFDAAPEEMQYLKNRSYGFAYLCLAWKPIQSAEKDYQKALEFHKLARTYDPSLLLSREYLRLTVAIAVARFLGEDGYQKMRSSIYGLLGRSGEGARG
jgi:glycosyltransferase involved in cell wall biosynthesis